MRKLKNSENEIMILQENIATQQESYYLELQSKNDDISQLREELISKEQAFENKLAETIKIEKKKSNDTQRSVIKGQIGENFAPFMNGFDYNPSDCQFLGQPIDFIIFNNLHKCSENECSIEDVSVVLAEIKTGKSSLNKRQKILQEVINRGQVSFETFRIDDDYPPTIHYEEKHSSNISSAEAIKQDNPPQNIAQGNTRLFINGLLRG